MQLFDEPIVRFSLGSLPSLTFLSNTGDCVLFEYISSKNILWAFPDSYEYYSLLTMNSIVDHRLLQSLLIQSRVAMARLWFHVLGL